MNESQEAEKEALESFLTAKDELAFCRRNSRVCVCVFPAPHPLSVCICLCGVIAHDEGVSFRIRLTPSDISSADEAAPPFYLWLDITWPTGTVLVPPTDSSSSVH